MSEAPERITAWLSKDGSTRFEGGRLFPAGVEVEYIRADRIEELEAANRGLVRLNETTEARAKAAEEKLAKAVEELQFDYDTLGEINPSNYNHDDVCNLNDKSVEVILSIKATLAELTGGKDE